MFSIEKAKVFAPDDGDNKVQPSEASQNPLRKKSEYDESISLKPKDAPDNILGTILVGSLQSNTVIVDPLELKDHTTVPFGGLSKDKLEDPEFAAILENHLKTSQDEIEVLNEKANKIKELLNKRKAVTEPVKGEYVDVSEAYPNAELTSPNVKENENPNKPKKL